MSCFAMLLTLSCSPATPSGTTPAPTPAPPKNERVTDRMQTTLGELQITPIYHATLLLQVGGKAIYVDPWSKGDFTGLPKADVVLITDIHQDHLDGPAIEAVRKPTTTIVAPPAALEKLPGATPLKNGETRTVEGVGIEAVPMYNLVRGPSEGKLFHDKGRGNGYVLTFGDKRLYVSGDTECTDEMRGLKNVDLAFVCMNLPYTMTPEEAAECVKAFKPKVVLPYHFRDSKLEGFTSALQGSGTEVRVRRWY